MKRIVKKQLLVIIGVLFGGIIGYLYWHQVGCDSGSCAITSNPTNSTLYGALMGGLLLSIFKKEN